MKLRSALLLGSALALTAAAAKAEVQPAKDPSDRIRPDSASQPAFIAPAHPLILTRELRRKLADGKEVISRRRYRIQFVPELDGYRINGELVSTEVEAPPVLAMLAEIERNRKDDGLFPLRLNHAGQIVSQQGARDPAASGQARKVLGSALEKIAFAGADRQVATDMAQRIGTQISQAGGNWPADLFHPQTGQRANVRQMGLPDASQGTVTVTINASASLDGLLRQMDRVVVTELQGTRRESRESWTLSDNI